MTSIADRIFPAPLASLAELEQRFPQRDLPEGAMVTRVGPSPTGFMHIGTLYTGLICSQFARQTGGVAFLRIEDTDRRRLVEGAEAFLIEAFKRYGVTFDEGADLDGSDRGAYGPYRQSEREAVYKACVKALVEKGLAYPCFATSEELDALREQQDKAGLRTGYYGQWATWRNKSEDEIHAALDAGKDFVIRLRAPGKHSRKIRFEDVLFGFRQMPENDHDVVILKSEGLPTYHFAHVVDDHFMRTTHVIRGDEWLVSVPLHLQLFEAMGWEPPAYAHIAPINKMDEGSRRKLSKRKDPEASVAYFEQQGYPRQAVIDYLLTLADAAFEPWKQENPDTDSLDFPMTFKGLKGSSGPLFDFVKLGNISRHYIASLSAQEVYDRALAWADAHDDALAALMRKDPEQVRSALDIERGGDTSRKDIETWADVSKEVSYFFDDHFALQADEARAMLSYLTADELAAMMGQYLEMYDPADDREAWFAKLRTLADQNGFALRPNDYKKNPDAYRGVVADVAKIFRVLLTGNERSPDLYSVMQVMGEDKVRRRIALVM
ncbi:MAG: glutamate--tRNA ligase [Alphaproteobacteria bacterium]|nr:glutamate--tRNA ligase [Alphaproteobacteria bacterium]